MKKTALITLTAIGLLSLARAQEQVPLAKAQELARLVHEHAQGDIKPPLRVQPDLLHPVALHEGDYGGMFIPDKRLAKIKVDRVRKRVRPVGELWLYNLAPLQNGTIVSQDKLAIVKVSTDEGEVKVTRCTLGLRRGTDGKPELVVLGKDKAPLLTAEVEKAEPAGVQPPTMTAQVLEDYAGRVSIWLPGNYKASFLVSDLYLY